ncbi:AAA family ATPase [Pseudomonas sp. GX19020]|uniref:AAA family ATPase n=1 Tax=Pseudomonas sp. GX19020 TaxID=2942277 RepID=UPI002018A63E|nr:AAA family ATPase [Pseudomonas sp. GX19020]MCL4065392.1 AAA family ATPase [Pseudomonas sp. GX19020]
MTVYDIIISNCNSIDLANIALRKGALNIKYGPNGIGKSTISKAIARQINPDLDLSDLTPFRNSVNSSAPAPEVSGTGDLRTVAIFDDSYVQQFVFQKDEVLKNSFEIFIKTTEYLAEMAELDRLLHGIRQAFSDNAQIESTLKDLKELRDAFGKSKSGDIPKSSRAYKGLVSVNKLENIPETLLPYAAYLQSDEPSKWITWQVQGNGFLNLADNCPYCSKDISTPEHKEVVQSVEKEYDATTAGHISALKSVLDKLGDYLSEKTRDNLANIIKSKVELQPDEQAFLTGLKAHAEALVAKMEGLCSLSFFSLRDQVEISEKLTPLKIDLAMIDTMDSEETRRTVDPINAQLDDLIGKAAILKGMIDKNKAKISKTIKDNQESINAFLKSAGYRYVVEIVPEADSYKMKLNHIDQPGHIETASRHLSYGEKNAFALVLFMYQVMRDNPDLVVLDDPISSFDKNKKFAILHELFNGRASLRGRTTLLLTHDIEPAIDVIKSITAVLRPPNHLHASCPPGQVSLLRLKLKEMIFRPSQRYAERTLPHSEMT